MMKEIDKEIYDDYELETFINMLNLEELFGIDLAYMGEAKIPNINKYAIEHFNNTLMRCKIEKHISLISLLSKISEIYMTPSKIKAYINSDIKWELIDEGKSKYKNIREDFPDSFDFF